MIHLRDETIWVNAILRIVFECIAIYCHIAIFYWILVKRHFIWEYGFWPRGPSLSEILSMTTEIHDEI